MSKKQKRVSRSRKKTGKSSARAEVKRPGGPMNKTEKAAVKERCLAKLREGYSPARAARAAGVHRRTLLQWRTDDSEFDHLCLDAIEEGTDEIEDVALQQAKRGSSIITMFLLNGRRPEKFKRQNEKGDTIPQEVTFSLNIGFANAGPERAAIKLPEARQTITLDAPQKE